MTKEERLAYEYGKKAFQNGTEPAPCCDPGMRPLVSDARSESGSRRNQRNMRAWYGGWLEECAAAGGDAAAAAQQKYNELYEKGPKEQAGRDTGMQMR